MTGRLSEDRFNELWKKELIYGSKISPSECKEFYDHYKEIRDEAIELNTKALTVYYKDILDKYWKVYSESL